MKTVFTSLVAMVLLANAVMAQDQEPTQTQQEKQTAVKSKMTDIDQLRIAVQKICPVMGAELGSMGEPIKVRLGKQIAYLCCRACVSKQVDAKHWATIQANIATAQGTCPIMGKPVSADMKSTIVQGQQVFVCCPPCIDKIQANPQATVKKLNASYAAFVQAEANARSDQLHIKAQAICPVSGQKLGSMGAPIKVKVGEEHAFLCCQGCQNKKLNAKHWAAVQANLAKAQGVCPIMGKPISAEKESTVVKGRRIFVCCPPCIDEIRADEPTYLAKLDAQIAAGVKARAASDSAEPTRDK